MQVLLARIDYLRRKGKEGYPETRQTFKAAQELLASYFPGWLDRSLLFVMYEADCALRLGDGITEARAVWNAALKTPLNKCASLFSPLLDASVLIVHHALSCLSLFSHCVMYGVPSRADSRPLLCTVQCNSAETVI